MPVILLTSDMQRIDAAARRTFREKRARGNLVMVERPVRPLSLRSAVDAALVTRMRQYELCDYQEALQALTARLIEAQEAECKHLALELHDIFSQKCNGSRDGGPRADLPESSAALSGRLLNFTGEIGILAKDIHRIPRQLHPAILDDLGLAAALRNKCIVKGTFRVQSEPGKGHASRSTGALSCSLIG